MKAIYFVAAAALLVGTSSFAQDATEESSTTTSTTTTTTTSTTTAAPTTTSTATTTSSTGAGTSTTSLPDATAAAKPKKWGASLALLTGMDATTFKNGKSAANDSFTRDRFTFSYSLSETQKVAIRQEAYFYHGYAGTAGARAVMSSTRLGYTDSKFMSLPGDWNLANGLYYYAPTSESSRFVTKDLGIAMVNPTMSKQFGKLGLMFDFVAYYYINSNNFQTNGKTANNDYRFEPYVGVDYTFNDFVSVYHLVGTVNIFKRPGTDVKRVQTFYNETGVTVNPMKKVSITALLANDTNIWDSSNAFGLYRDDETSYYINVGLSL